MMNEKEKLYDTLLQLGTALREKRAHVYGVGWDMHRKKVEAVCEADKQYVNLPLTEEQKEVIEKMLEKRMEANECELTLTYAAGILDGIMYLRNAGFLDLYVVDEEQGKDVLKEMRKGCYVIAVIPGRDGCLAAWERTGGFREEVGGKGNRNLCDQPAGSVCGVWAIYLPGFAGHAGRCAGGLYGKERG